MQHRKPQSLLRIVSSLWFILQIQTAYASSGSGFFNSLHPEEFGKTSSLEFGQGRVDIAECQDIKPTGPIDATLCDYETVNQVNGDLYENLRELVKAPFFRYFQMDLYRGCPFWQDSETCTTSSCGLETVDESEVPEQWRTKALSMIDPLPEDYHQLTRDCYYRDTDFCVSEDPTSTSGDYFDLLLIPERYTGYSGAGARQIWRSIYEDNCFTPVESADGSLASKTKADQEKCLEAKVYGRIISGLHASISTHICLDYLNQTTGKWAPNLQCYIERVASHPERLENIYFNVVLLLRAISRLGPHLSVYDYRHQDADISDNEPDTIKTQLDKVLSLAHRAGKFDETVMFSGEDAKALKEEFKSHFRNVTRIMDCIECDQCRLWGKVQTMGVATALKILFELDDNALSLSPHSSKLLQRSEVVALFSTLHRFSESLRVVQQFRNMWSSSEEADTRAAAKTLIELENDATIDGADTNVVDDIRIDETGQNTFIYVVNKTCEKVAQLCKDGAVGYVSMISRLWSRGLECLESLATHVPTRSNSEL